MKPSRPVPKPPGEVDQPPVPPRFGRNDQPTPPPSKQLPARVGGDCFEVWTVHSVVVVVKSEFYC